MIDLWYKEAILYEIDVKTFQDSNNDGTGDFQGLIRRLPYLSGLGVTCVWLQPFYPSPLKDDGYDVTDFYNVDPQLVSLGDFVDFVRQARDRGMRVLIDLVVNHTSDQHPWYQAARQSTSSPFRDYYIWSKSKPANAEKGVIFPGTQRAVWSYDDVAGEYYHHHFYQHQPDLNIANPTVRAEICRIMGFWLELGISGFRLDAAPFLGGKPDEGGNPPQQLFEHLEEFREFLSWRSGSAVILAEANVSVEEMEQYFADGPQIHMLFNFLLNQRVFLALARGEAAPIVDLLKKLPDRPTMGQYGNFLRNHDELSLDRLSKSEREEVFAAFGPEKAMQAYGRGIRRRLAPMFGGDLAQQKLAYSLTLTLPGTPVLRYGDEISMGDDLSLQERLSVRTPMQWCASKNGGFSEADPERLIRPAITTSDYGFDQVNVADHDRDPESLLNWMEHAIRVRKMCPEFGWGEFEVLSSGHRSVFAHRCEFQQGAVIAVHNLSADSVQTDLKLEPGEHLLELLGSDTTEPFDHSPKLSLQCYEFRWFRVRGNAWRDF